MEELKNTPQYLKVKLHILEQLRTRALKPHDKLPTERELSDRFTVNRNTVRHALAILEREGKIYRSGRKGWFTSGQRLIFDPSREHVNFDKRARQQGFTPAWQITESGMTPATGEFEYRYDLDGDSDVDGDDLALLAQVFGRCRDVDDWTVDACF